MFESLLKEGNEADYSNLPENDLKKMNADHRKAFSFLKIDNEKVIKILNGDERDLSKIEEFGKKLHLLESLRETHAKNEDALWNKKYPNMLK